MNFEQALKAANVAKGARAIKRVKLPLVNSPGPLLPDQPELAEQRARDGVPERSEIDVGVRAMRPSEFEQVIVGALEYAKARGVTEEPLSPIYSLGYRYTLLAITLVDPDSDPKDPEPFFGKRGDVASAIEAMRSSDHLTDDSLMFLAEHQDAWQQQVSPTANRLAPAQLWVLMKEVAASTDASPFLQLRVGMQWQFVQFLVSQLSIARTDSLPTPSDSSAPTS